MKWKCNFQSYPFLLLKRTDSYRFCQFCESLLIYILSMDFSNVVSLTRPIKKFTVWHKDALPKIKKKYTNTVSVMYGSANLVPTICLRTGLCNFAVCKKQHERVKLSLTKTILFQETAYAYNGKQFLTI